MEPLLRAGTSGCGHWARDTHLPVFATKHMVSTRAPWTPC